MKKAGIAVLIILVVIVGALFVLPPMIGGNMVKTRVADAVRDATGREMDIQGNVSLSLLPSLSLDMKDVRLANPPGMSDDNMVTLGGVVAEIAVIPAVFGRNIEVNKLILEEPKIFPGSQ